MASKRVVDPAERVGSFQFKRVGIVPQADFQAQSRVGPILDMRLAVPCCERDTDNDGNCDRHPKGLYEVIPCDSSSVSKT